MEIAKALKLHEAGRARILAVAMLKRIPNLPDIPTLDEVGIKGFQSGTWNAIAAPPKTPKAIVAKLNKAVNAALAKRAGEGAVCQGEPAPGGRLCSEHAATFIKEETKLWDNVIKQAHIPTTSVSTSDICIPLLQASRANVGIKRTTSNYFILVEL